MKLEVWVDSVEGTRGARRDHLGQCGGFAVAGLGNGGPFSLRSDATDGGADLWRWCFVIPKRHKTDPDEVGALKAAPDAVTPDGNRRQGRHFPVTAGTCASASAVSACFGLENPCSLNGLSQTPAIIQDRETGERTLP